MPFTPFHLGPGCAVSESVSRFGRQAARNALAALRSRPPARPATALTGAPARPGEVLDALGRVGVRLPSLAGDLHTLGRLLDVDVASTLNKIRYIAEKVLHALCEREAISWGPGEPTLERMIGPLVATRRIPRDVAIHVRTIQTNASPGSHFQEVPLSAPHVTIALTALLEFLRWSESAN